MLKKTIGHIGLVLLVVIMGACSKPDAVYSPMSDYSSCIPEDDDIGIVENVYGLPDELVAE